jgi:DNA repair protein RadC
LGRASRIGVLPEGLPGADTCRGRLKPKEETLTDAPKPPIFRVRELTVTYKPHRLHSPFTGRLDQPAAVARLTADILQDSAMETLLILHVNIRHNLIGIHRIPGTLDHVEVNVGDICRAALLSNALGFIVAHNHLSGDPTPSNSDRKLVQRLKDAARLLDLEFFDAVIVVDSTESAEYYSFRENDQL